MTDEKLLALLETPAENESKLDAVIKEEMSEDAVRAVRAALRLLDAFKDEIPSDTLRGLADAAGMDLHEEEVDPTKGYADEQTNKEATASDLLKTADLPEELRPTIEALWKSNEEAATRVAELEGVLKGERDRRLLSDETERVTKAFGHVPGIDADSLATMLIHLRKAAPDSATSVEEVLAATERAMTATQDDAFEETGVTVSAEPGATTAWGRVEAMASQLVTKGEKSTQAQAIDHILTVNPELYSAYLNEKGA